VANAAINTTTASCKTVVPAAEAVANQQAPNSAAVAKGETTATIVCNGAQAAAADEGLIDSVLNWVFPPAVAAPATPAASQ
jgi:hypothetical protein